MLYVIVTKSQIGVSLDILYDFLQEPELLVAFIGPVQSPVADVIAQVLKRRNVIQVSVWTNISVSYVSTCSSFPVTGTSVISLAQTKLNVIQRFNQASDKTDSRLLYETNNILHFSYVSYFEFPYFYRQNWNCKIVSFFPLLRTRLNWNVVSDRLSVRC